MLRSRYGQATVVPAVRTPGRAAGAARVATGLTPRSAVAGKPPVSMLLSDPRAAGTTSGRSGGDPVQRERQVWLTGDEATCPRTGGGQHGPADRAERRMKRRSIDPGGRRRWPPAGKPSTASVANILRLQGRLECAQAERGSFPPRPGARFPGRGGAGQSSGSSALSDSEAAPAVCTGSLAYRLPTEPGPGDCPEPPPLPPMLRVRTPQSGFRLRIRRQSPTSSQSRTRSSGATGDRSSARRRGAKERCRSLAVVAERPGFR